MNRAEALLTYGAILALTCAVLVLACVPSPAQQRIETQIQVDKYARGLADCRAKAHAVDGGAKEKLEAYDRCACDEDRKVGFDGGGCP